MKTLLAATAIAITLTSHAAEAAMKKSVTFESAGQTLAGDLYLDGQEIASVASGAYDEGLFGVYIGSAVTPNLTVNVDEYAYWKLP